MNRNLSFVLVASAAVCGLALAQVPQKNDAAQLAALQLRVEKLEADLADLKKATPGTGDFAAGIAQDHKTLEQVVKYTTAQSGACAKLQEVLDDSRVKGFTFGINPESREVLLQGFHDFANTLQSSAPKVEATPEVKGNGSKAGPKR